MNKAISALILVAGVAGGFFAGRWWQRPAGKKHGRPKKSARAGGKGGAAEGKGRAADRVAELAKRDPEIAKFAAANPALVAKALKDPGSLASDPTFLAWAATHPAQLVALQEAVKPSAPAIPAGPAAKV